MGYGRPTPKKQAYKYYKFTPTLASGSTAVQIARVYFYTGSNKQTQFSDSTSPNTVIVTNPGGSNPAGELPSNAMLSALPSGSSKWLDFNKQSLVFEFPTSQNFNGYEWYTANDTQTFTDRQPTSWSVSASTNNVTYTQLHTANTSSAGYLGITNNSIAYSVRNAW